MNEAHGNDKFETNQWRKFKMAGIFYHLVQMFVFGKHALWTKLVIYEWTYILQCFFFTRAWQIFRLSYNPYSHINDYSSVHAELLWRSVYFNIQIQGITFLQFWRLKLVFYLGQIYSKLLIKVEPTRNTKIKNTHNQLSNQINQKPNIRFVLFLFL